MKRSWQKILMSSVSLGAVMIFAAPAGAACTPTPDCAALGYTETSCANGGVKCPWDAGKMFCKEDFASLCMKLPMAVGDILYSDKTYCSPDVHKALVTMGEATKTPIGIISYMNGSTRLAIQLIGLEDKRWSWSSIDVPGITNYGSSPHTTDFNGKTNTYEWTKTLWSTSTSYAAGYCYNYSTPGTTKHDWYLPAQGELYASIWTNKSQVNAGLGKVSGASTIVNNWHWSSSELSGDDAWYVYASNGNVGTLVKHAYGAIPDVRCVLAF